MFQGGSTFSWRFGSKWLNFFLALVAQFFSGEWLTFFLTIACEITGGEMMLHVHADAQWVSAREMRNFEFMPADVEIVNRLAGNSMEQIENS